MGLLNQKPRYVFSPNCVLPFYFAILHGQLQIALESCAHRLTIEQFLCLVKTLLNHPTLRNDILKFFTDGSRSQIRLISPI